jgi:hypothetical protein
MLPYAIRAQPHGMIHAAELVARCKYHAMKYNFARTSDFNALRLCCARTARNINTRKLRAYRAIECTEIRSNTSPRRGVAARRRGWSVGVACGCAKNAAPKSQERPPQPSQGVVRASSLAWTVMEPSHTFAKHRLSFQCGANTSEREGAVYKHDSTF